MRPALPVINAIMLALCFYRYTREEMLDFIELVKDVREESTKAPTELAIKVEREAAQYANMLFSGPGREKRVIAAEAKGYWMGLQEAYNEPESVLDMRITNTGDVWAF